MLPGLQPDAKRILTNIEILDLREVPKSLGDHRRRARWGSSSRPASIASAPKSRCSRCCRASCRSKTKKSRRNWSGCSRRAAFASKPARGSRISRGTITACGSPRRSPTASSENFEVETLLVAVGRKPLTEESRPRRHARRSSIAGSSRSTLSAHRRAGRLRDRRYRRGTPQLAHVATAEGMVAIGAYRGQAGDADQ